MYYKSWGNCLKYNKKWVSSAAFFVLVAALFFVQVIWVNVPEDDAFIHFRIAENLARAGFPYYNLNEAVNGSSSTVWIWLLALIFLTMGTSFEAIQFANSFFIAGSIYFLAPLYHPQHTPYRLFSRLAFAGVLLALLLMVSASLMETAFCVFVVAAGLHFLAKKHPAGLAIIAVSIFIRYEMAVFFALFIAYALYRREISVKQVVVTTAPIFLLSCAYHLWMFRTLLPQSVIAKSIVYQVEPGVTFIHALVGFIPFFYAGNTLQGVIAGVFLVLVFVLLYLCFFLLQLVKKAALYPWNEQIIHLFTLSGFMLIFLYTANAVLIFAWYKPLFTVPIVLGIINFFSNSRAALSRSIGLVIVGLYLAGLVQQSFVIAQSSPGTSIDESVARVKTYLSVGKALYQQYPNYTLRNFLPFFVTTHRVG